MKEPKRHHRSGAWPDFQARLLAISSGPPWNLTCTVDALGADFVCHIHGGEAHLGAMAVSQWNGTRPQTRSLVIDHHKEGPIATHAAHQLCLASHRPVTCIAGIHFDSPTSDQIVEISDAAHALAVQAAEQLKVRRYRQALDDPTSTYSRLRRGIEPLRREIRQFMEQPIELAHQRHSRQLQESQWKHFGNRILLFAPLYLSNACLNDCVYCGFRRHARQERIRLPQARAVEEARILAERGHRTIDLVTGEIPSETFTRDVCAVIREIRTKTPIQNINLNLGSLPLEHYEELLEAGATGYHLYQETYDPETYLRVHRDGPKRHMEERLAGLHRAAKAGFRQLGAGILLGLHDVVDDLAALVRHAEILLEDHPQVRLGFSLPRIQVARGQLAEELHGNVPDDDLAKALLFLRLRFPRAPLTSTTRESAAFRDRLVPLGITKMSAGVSTAPGGYGSTARSEHGSARVTVDASGEESEQFAVHDGRSLEEVRLAIIKCGRVPTYQ